MSCDCCCCDPRVCAGAASLLSIGHFMYAMHHMDLKNDVPIHFGISGEPDNSVSPKYFFIYPLLVTGASLTASVIKKQKCTTAMAGWVLLGCQFYAARIAAGSSSKLPWWMPVAMIVAILLPEFIGPLLCSHLGCCGGNKEKSCGCGCSKK